MFMYTLNHLIDKEKREKKKTKKETFTENQGAFIRTKW